MMEQEVTTCAEPIYYFTNFALFSQADIHLLCLYKKFIKAVVMQLGRDWRIQSSLLTEQIIAIKSSTSTDTDIKNFNLFNQFLSNFLKGRANKQFQFSNLSESKIQNNFLETVSKAFPEQLIKESLTFKTLSIGFCITASEIWTKTFKKLPEKIPKQQNTLKIFAKVSPSNNGGQQDTWSIFNIEEIEASNIVRIQNSLSQNYQLQKAHIFSDFVCYVNQIQVRDKKVRVFELANQFYVRSLIVWLIFSMKMFGSLNFQDYITFCKDFMEKDWQEGFEKPLLAFQQILQTQWNKLLQDYTVALHDDFEVLRMVIERVRGDLQREWQNRLSMVNPILTG